MKKGANDMANVKVRLMDKDEDYKKMGEDMGLRIKIGG